MKLGIRKLGNFGFVIDYIKYKKIYLEIVFEFHFYFNLRKY